MDRKCAIKKYIIGNQIGKGAFGHVYSAKFNPEYLEFEDLEEPEILTSLQFSKTTDNVGLVETSDSPENKETNNSPKNKETNDSPTNILLPGPKVEQNIDYDKKMAIKITKNEPRFIRAALKEIAILEELNINNRHNAPIINLLDSYLEDEIPYLVFEKMDINLYRFYRDNHISYPTSMSIFYQIALALEYIHGRNIIHMDLKPENIMLDYKCTTLKIIDFGSASRTHTKHKYFYVQSRYYRAPEVVFNLEISPAIDVWSLGCIIFEILFKKPLFPARESNYELIYLFSISLGVPLEHAAGMDRYFFSPIFKKQYIWNIKMQKYELKHKQVNDMPIDKFGLEKRIRRKLQTEYPNINTFKLLQVLLKILTYNYEQRLHASEILEYGYLGNIL